MDYKSIKKPFIIEIHWQVQPKLIDKVVSSLVPNKVFPAISLSFDSNRLITY